MKRVGLIATLACVLAGGRVFAAYPIYTQNGQAVVPQQYTQNISIQYPTQTGYSQVLQNPQPVSYMPQTQTQMQGMPAAANPHRVTGALPRVGKDATAGRQYYQPEDYDRLADSGLYIGLSIGYAVSVLGQIKTDYANEKDAFFAPGAFVGAAYKTDTVLPLQLSVGAAINSDLRVDFSYSRYSGISYPNSVQTGAGPDESYGFTDVQATGGAISSNATMLNLYYNLDSFTGYMAGGALRPYVGLGVGIATNTIADYLVYDPNFYSEQGIVDGEIYDPGTLTAISDIYAYHAGGTMEQLAYMLEGGVTTELDSGMKIDFFVRYSGLGKVQSSGSIVVSQTEWLSTGQYPIGTPGAEQPAEYDSVFHYTNWRESGQLSTIDLGVRMRIQF